MSILRDNLPHSSATCGFNCPASPGVASSHPSGWLSKTGVLLWHSPLLIYLTRMCLLPPAGPPSLPISCFLLCSCSLSFLYTSLTECLRCCQATHCFFYSILVLPFQYWIPWFSSKLVVFSLHDSRKSTILKLSIPEVKSQLYRWGLRQVTQSLCDLFPFHKIEMPCVLQGCWAHTWKETSKFLAHRRCSKMLTSPPLLSDMDKSHHKVSESVKKL